MLSVVSPNHMVKLMDKKIKWTVKQAINKGECTEMVVAIYCLSNEEYRN